MKKKVGDSPVGLGERLYVGRPNVGDSAVFLRRVQEMLDRHWFTNDGPLVREFEERIADFVGVRNCVATCNATIALEMAYRALSLEGEVIVPSFTFIATAHALHWQGIRPVFCDIDPATHNIDPDEVERLITPATTGIVGVHLWGRPCRIDMLEAIAKRHNLRLVFDAAHAFGGAWNGQRIGNFGDCEVFSFHATKFLNSFEGGAVATNDDGLAEKLRLMRNFGFSDLDTVIQSGVNGKMTEVCAAMGLTNFEIIGELIETNRINYETYRQAMSSIPGLHLIDYKDNEAPNYQYIVLEVDEKVSGISRDALIEVLHSKNVLARRYFYPGCHRMEPYISLYPDSGGRLANTEGVASRVVCLPTGGAVTARDIGQIAWIIQSAAGAR